MCIVPGHPFAPWRPQVPHRLPGRGGGGAEAGAAAVRGGPPAHPPHVAVQQVCRCGAAPFRRPGWKRGGLVMDVVCVCVVCMPSGWTPLFEQNWPPEAGRPWYPASALTYPGAQEPP